MRKCRHEPFVKNSGHTGSSDPISTSVHAQTPTKTEGDAKNIFSASQKSPSLTSLASLRISETLESELESESEVKTKKAAPYRQYEGGDRWGCENCSLRGTNGKCRITAVVGKGRSGSGEAGGLA